MDRHGSDADENPLVMTQQRLQDLLDAYGADPLRWPVDERAAAVALLARSADARASQEKAAQLDRVLDCSPSIASSAAFTRCLLAHVSPQETVETESQRRPVVSRVRPGQRMRGWETDRSAFGRGEPSRRMWSSLVAALLVIVSVWSTRGLWIPQPTPPLDPATLGVYETPTDALLEPPGFDLFSAMPAVGCEDSELACPRFDASQEIQSQSHVQRGKLV